MATATPGRVRRTPAVQASFEDLGTPLVEVTFCVVDLETTGGSPAGDRITEVGAVKVRGGEVLGTFQTLVNPGVAVPPFITVLTGITDAMVAPAPRIEAVLGPLEEFMRGCVLVAHNARFDVGFLNAARLRAGWEPLAVPVVDTAALARRLVREEVPDCRLGTLADRLRLDHRPRHRALEDALATVDLLHALLERAGTLGVTGLDDLLALPTLSRSAAASKLRWTDRLPRSPGVYVFRDRRGRILYVGRATNLRSRVRSYFAADTRRSVPRLLREAAAVDHIPTPTTVEAAALEARLIAVHEPPHNRRGRRWRRYRWVRLDPSERFPRLTVTARARPDGALLVGPVASTRVARLVVEAVQTAVPLRRCTRRPPRRPAGPVCTPAQLGVATCPCAGQVDEATYRRIVRTAVRGLTTEPALLCGPLEDRMRALAAAERFEEAADVRDRAAALVGALERQRRLESLRRAGELVVEVPGPGGEPAVVRLWEGRLVGWPTEAPVPHDLRVVLEAEASPPVPDTPMDGVGGLPAPVPADAADEILAVAGELGRLGRRVRLVAVSGTLAEPWPRLPTFRAVGTTG